MLGLGAPCVIATDERFKMDMQALRRQVEQDRAAGYQPFCVVGTAGTVATGAIDDLGAIADFCEEQELWFHVDAAMGAFGVLDPQKTHLYAGMDRADSLALDPHKGLNVAIDCSCAVLRSGQLLRETFSLVPPYLQLEEGRGFGGLPGFAEYGFKQTQRNLALKLDWVIQYAGREGLQRMVTRHHALSQRLADSIAASGDLELLAPVELCIVNFRYVPPTWSRDDGRLNALQDRIVALVQERGRVFLHRTVLHDRDTSCRACVMHFDTNEVDIDLLAEEVRAAGAQCAREVDGFEVAGAAR